MRSARFPDTRAQPGKRGGDQVDHGAQHENFERAVPLAQRPEKGAQDPVGHAENTPGNQAGSEQVCGLAEKAQHRDEGQYGDDGRSGEVALHGDAIENRNAIREINPAGERKRKAATDDQADAHSSVPQNRGRMVFANLWTSQHRKKGKQVLNQTGPKPYKPKITGKVAQFPQPPGDLARSRFRRGQQPLRYTNNDVWTVQRYHDMPV